MGDDSIGYQISNVHASHIPCVTQRPCHFRHAVIVVLIILPTGCIKSNVVWECYRLMIHIPTLVAVYVTSFLASCYRDGTSVADL